MKSKEMFPAIFSRHAAEYQRRLEDVMSRGEAAGRIRLIGLVEALPGMRILDLACGPGTLSRRLASLVAPDGEVVGVDLAPGMIELASALKIANARFEIMDIEHLAFPEGSFDGAVCGHGMQFTSSLPAALGEARRVLRSGARLAASVPLAATIDPAWALVDEVIDRWLPPPPKAVDQEATRATVRDPAAFRQAALDAGFQSAAVEVISERVRWESAAQLVSMFMSWWDCAARMEGLDAARRSSFAADARTTLEAAYPGAVETTGRNHVLLAVA